MRLIRLASSAALLSVMLPLHAQHSDDIRLRHLRTDRIGYCHINVGLDAGVNTNYTVAPRVGFGIGTYRNMLCADVTVGYTMRNPVTGGSKEGVSAGHLTLALSGDVNVLRRRHTSLYAGAKLGFNAAVASGHTNYAEGATEPDITVAQSYCSLRGQLGCRFGQWNVGTFYEYDLAPAFRQKDIFESTSFDYYALHKSIFERWRIGIGATYYFNL